MTRPLPKAVPFFPDWERVLSRAAKVETEAVRACELCGSEQAEMRPMQSYDGWKCVAESDCGRRALESRRVG